VRGKIGLAAYINRIQRSEQATDAAARPSRPEWNGGLQQLDGLRRVATIQREARANYRQAVESDRCIAEARPTLSGVRPARYRRTRPALPLRLPTIPLSPAARCAAPDPPHGLTCAWPVAGDPGTRARRPLGLTGARARLALSGVKVVHGLKDPACLRARLCKTESAADPRPRARGILRRKLTTLVFSAGRPTIIASSTAGIRKVSRAAGSTSRRPRANPRQT
jgi:hypothetical protein